MSVDINSIWGKRLKVNHMAVIFTFSNSLYTYLWLIFHDLIFLTPLFSLFLLHFNLSLTHNIYFFVPLLTATLFYKRLIKPKLEYYCYIRCGSIFIIAKNTIIVANGRRGSEKSLVIADYPSPS